MALPARQPIQDDDGLGKAAANDNFEIKNVKVAGTDNAVVEGKKIKFSLEDIQQKAVNDNVEIDEPTDTKQTTSTPTPTTPETKTPTDTNAQPENNQTKNDTQPSNNLQTPSDAQSTEEKDSSGPKNPPLLNDEEKPWRSDANPNANKQLPEKNGQTREDLANTGPHPTTEKSPNTIPPENQNKTASDLSQSKSLGAGVGAALANKAKNQIESIKKGVKELPKNAINNLKNKLSNDTIRKVRLLRDKRKLEAELRKLENKVGAVKGDLAMLLLQWWLPTIYNAIMGFSVGIKKRMANASEATMVKILEKGLETLKTIKAMLEAAQSTTSLTMALVNTGKIIAAGFEAFVIPGILLIIVSPFIVLILWIKNRFILKDKLTAAVYKIEIKINALIKDLEETFKPLKQRVQIRKKIQVINRLMAATAQERKSHYEQPPDENPQQENTDSQQTPSPSQQQPEQQQTPPTPTPTDSQSNNSQST